MLLPRFHASFQFIWLERMTTLVDSELKKKSYLWIQNCSVIYSVKCKPNPYTENGIMIR